MAGTVDATEASLLDKIVSRCRERLPGDEGDRAAEFARQYYAFAPPDYLQDRSPLDVYGAALAHWGFAAQRAPGSAKVRVYNPQFETHGWQSSHTVVEIVSDDMPFLVDSVSMELRRQSYAIHFVLNAVLEVRRDPRGQLVDVLARGARAEDAIAESVIHLEINRETSPGALQSLREDLRRVLGDVRAAFEDWPAMRERARALGAELAEQDVASIEPEHRAEVRAFLEWIDDEHFVFLGYREYDLVTEDGEDGLRAVPSTGLGVLRDAGGDGRAGRASGLTKEGRRQLREPRLLYLTKANRRATVHRAAQLDYIGIQRFDASGAIVGEHRFLGLYTSAAYRTSFRDIPLVRRKGKRVLERAGFAPASHNDKAVAEILETYRRDELFQISEQELFETSMGILHLGERQRVRLFVRHDVYGRFLSCLVFVPRDRYNTDARQRIQDILQAAFGGSSVDYSARISESVLARLHVIVHVDAGELPAYDLGQIEGRIVEATRLWRDDLADALADAHGEERAGDLARRYGEAFPAGYRADFVSRAAVSDIEHIESLSGDQALGMSLYRPLEAPEGFLRFKLFKSGEPISLSRAVPVFENMGVRVADERPYELTPLGRPPVWIYDFGLSYGVEGELQADEVKEIFQDAFASVWRGEAENDGFNRLVLRARLTWREIVVLRAVCKYLRQAGIAFSQNYMARTLAANAGVASLLVELFHARFDPARSRTGKGVDRLAEVIEGALEEVPSLDEDRILRRFLAVVQAILRTNHYQRDGAGRLKPYMSFKLDPSQVPELPLPRPMFEVFVYSPRTEGVHLRGGRVARGGIRWSDRPEDFRTEVLGLMKAQMVKNAVIVPVGAKGGFVVKRPPAGGDREQMMEEVKACYRTLIRGMLDLTDDLKGGEVVAPADVVRYDGDDPYLVVAADKGTATFSDTANAIAGEYGYWLGDAFASGGSKGYDHKQIGITARGAWESVKRHFRELGTDVQSRPFTVAGIGDMSGDVFGNGMLLSRQIRLVAAFNHQHVFLDPDPDPATGHAERERLFALRGSWSDYDESLIAEGGGVFPRSAKSIQLSPQAAAALGVEPGAMTPAELIRAILRSPVDLLFNGGIGNYVKASSEAHADAGDRANDSVRIDAPELRCRVIGEGGNLGLTQLARVEYALADGRVSTDFIDNSGGVDCSDREVNIKILLDSVVASDDMTEKQRNELLADMTDSVAALVLADSYSHAQALGIARAQAPAMLEAHRRFIRSLEHGGLLDRQLERLPDNEQLAERKAAGLGLTAPEAAVLLAYAKIAIERELIDSDVPEDPYLAEELERYFPPPLPERFATAIQDHRLRREIIATHITNSMVNRAGMSFVFRHREETGARTSDIARAYAVAREVFDARGLWHAVEELDGLVAADVQYRMLLALRRLVERATRWLLRNRRPPLDIAATVAQLAPGARALAGAVPELLLESDREALEQTAEELRAAGVPDALATRVAGLGAAFSALDVADVAEATGHSVEDVASIYFALGSRLDLRTLRERIAGLERDDRWHALARGALRDELYAAHRSLAAEVLGTGAPQLPIAERLDAWMEENADALERCLQVLSDIRAAGSYDLATLSVALREIRALAQSAPGAAA